MKQAKLTYRQHMSCNAVREALDNMEWLWDAEISEVEYWTQVRRKLIAMHQHQTTDGKPWVEPIRVPTKDLLARSLAPVKVFVKDAEDVSEWCRTLLQIVEHRGKPWYVTEGRCGDKVSIWELARLPTDEEYAQGKVG